MITWNIAGIGKVERVKEFLGKYDVIALQETWLEKNREGELGARLDRNFNWVFKAAVRVNKKGRAKGGLAVGIRKSLKIWGIEEWEYGLVVKGLKIGGNKRVDLIVVYNNSKIEIVLSKISKMAEESVEQGNEINKWKCFNNSGGF